MLESHYISLRFMQCFLSVSLKPCFRQYNYFRFLKFSSFCCCHIFILFLIRKSLNVIHIPNFIQYIITRCNYFLILQYKEMFQSLLYNLRWRHCVNTSGTAGEKCVSAEEIQVDLVTVVVKCIPKFSLEITLLVSTSSAPLSWSS